MKTCSKCGETKSRDLFYDRKTARDGKMSSCKDCRNLYNELNKEKIAERKKAYYEANKHKGTWNAGQCPETKKKNSRLWAERNKDKIQESRKVYRQTDEGKAKRAEGQRRREAAKKRTVTLHEFDKEAVLDFYREARRLTDETGIPHEVDHIVPLLGENVCGLHVSWNLQILTREENAKKNNKFEIE